MARQYRRDSTNLTLFRRELVSIKYFTADISAKFSSRGDVSYRAQQDYLLSLQAHSKEKNARLEVNKGK